MEIHKNGHAGTSTNKYHIRTHTSPNHLINILSIILPCPNGRRPSITEPLNRMKSEIADEDYISTAQYSPRLESETAFVEN